MIWIRRHGQQMTGIDWPHKQKPWWLMRRGPVVIAKSRVRWR